MFGLDRAAGEVVAPKDVKMIREHGETFIAPEPVKMTYAQWRKLSQMFINDGS